MTTPGDVEYAGRKSLRGWTMDVMAQYYLERGKANAALHYMRKAMKHIASLPSSEGQAAWRAHLVCPLAPELCRNAKTARRFCCDPLSAAPPPRGNAPAEPRCEIKREHARAPYSLYQGRGRTPLSSRAGGGEGGAGRSGGSGPSRAQQNLHQGRQG
eukprot:1211304-Rhodomonas_salina.1